VAENRRVPTASGSSRSRSVKCRFLRGQVRIASGTGGSAAHCAARARERRLRGCRRAVRRKAGAVGTTPQVAIFGACGTRLGGFAPYDSTFTTGVFVAAGDVTGDGRADIVLGAGTGVGGHTDVRVVDADGNALASPFDAYPGFGGAFTVATGDIDGDGLGDVVTGASGGPHVRSLRARLVLRLRPQHQRPDSGRSAPTSRERGRRTSSPALRPASRTRRRSSATCATARVSRTTGRVECAGRRLPLRAPGRSRAQPPGTSGAPSPPVGAAILARWRVPSASCLWR
jgi:hypothetical protein